MSGRVVITGASGAMGEAAVRALARDGRSVLMACRNLEKAALVRSRIIADLPEADITLGLLDLASIDSVRAFVASLSIISGLSCLLGCFCLRWSPTPG